VFWVFWNLFVSACSAILLGDVIAKKTKIHEVLKVFREPLIDVRGNTILTGIQDLARRMTQHANNGYVGLEVTKKPPYLVLKVNDMIDKHGLFQHEPGYANSDNVVPNDQLIRVDGTSVESINVHNLNQLMRGSINSLAELCFVRAQTGEEFSITIKRHAPHLAAKSDVQSDARPDAQPHKNLTPAAADKSQQLAELKARVKDLEQDRKESRQECAELRRAIEELKESDCVKQEETTTANFQIKHALEIETFGQQNRALRQSLDETTQKLEVATCACCFVESLGARRRMPEKDFSGIRS